MAEGLLEKIRGAGIVGAGGGGFPTHVKYAASVDTVVANGAECEPLMYTDQSEMARRPDLVVRGLLAAMEITGAGRGIVALKAKYHAAIDALDESIRNKRIGDRVQLYLLNNYYPAGDEFVLVREVLGRVIPEFGLPLHVQAVVSNVTTLINVARAVDEGAPVTRRSVTVHGAVARPSVFEAPIGTPLRLLIEAAGGATVEPYRIVDGGPMMGGLAEDPDRPVTKAMSGILVLPSDHPVVVRREREMKRQIHMTRSACLKCMMCTEVCPRSLLGHRLYPDRLMRNIAAGISEDPQAFVGSYLCSECGLCAVYGCVMTLDPCRMNREIKQVLTEAGVPRPEPLSDLRPHRDWEIRKVPTTRLIARLGLLAYDRPAAPATFEKKPERLVIPLRQHTGAPAQPTVRPGDKVGEGDLIGEIPEKALGARVHASAGGIVAEVSEEAIVIKVDYNQ